MSQPSFPSRHIDVIIVGGGQAGLAISYCLQQRGIEHLVLERYRMGWAWHERRWDNFCLVTPNWQCQLPGFPYDGDDPHGFMVKQEILDYLERYAASFRPPLREGVEVKRITRDVNGRFQLATSDGAYSTQQVVIATGYYHHPRLPPLASRFPDTLTQIHSADYRSPAALPEGEVLVVGSGQSGAQIAEDLHLEGRKVHLCVGTAPRVSRFYRGRDVVDWLDEMGHYRLTIDDYPETERNAREKTNHYVTGRDGGRDIDLRQFALEGMQLYGRLLDCERNADGEAFLITSDDLQINLDNADAVMNRIQCSIDEYIEANDIDAATELPYTQAWQPAADQPRELPVSRLSAIIWSVGFETDFRWIQLPAFDAKGYPKHYRGVSSVDGLYFLGLPWLWTWGSGRFEGIAQDAEYLSEQVVKALQKQGMEAEVAHDR